MYEFCNIDFRNMQWHKIKNAVFLSLRKIMTTCRAVEQQILSQIIKIYVRKTFHTGMRDCT